MIPTRKLFAALVALMASVSVLAQHHQEAHVHGIAELFIVFEDKQLGIELHSPAMNLLGFEQHARTAEQRALIDNTKATLANANNLFQFDSAQCRLTQHTADFSHVQAHTDRDAHEHGEHEQHEPHQAHSHSDIAAHYHYHCDQAVRLDSLSTTVLTLFPGIQSLHVQWIINGRQGAATLDNSQQQIIFR